jgi:hypothetical protein
MPAGWPYFAWIDQSESIFTSAHMRWDEQVFSFTLSQDEGDPASLTVAVVRPRNTAGDPIGLLGPGRKIWCWFALDCGPDLIRFRGRLVGVPTSLFEDLVTLEFVAKPVDLVAQKAALANTLRVLPFYDPVVVDPASRSDPEVVLEGYTKIWHYDRETLVLTVSDEISGEDGLVTFDCNGTSEYDRVLYDGLALNLTSGPLARVDVSADYTWTQQGSGTIDLTQYLLSRWPGVFNGAITSYTLTASDWPKTGSTIGAGWIAAEATAYDLYDWSVKTNTSSQTLTIKTADETTGTSTATSSNSFVGSYAGTHAQFPAITTQDNWQYTQSKDGDGGTYVSSFTRSFSAVGAVIAEQSIRATLVAGYTAQRPYTETVSFSLFANVQPILTDPSDGEALRIDNIRSVNLSDPNEGTPIGDPRRSSYIATARGNQSLEHLIALARANLMKRARVVEITFVPFLERMCEITLRKNAYLVEPRVGEALGKIIGYSVALDGADGQIKCEVKIGCTIGRGGSAVEEDGTPSYCEIAYTGPDYQQFDNRIMFTAIDTSVGYAPPQAAPNDDGLNLLGRLSYKDVIEQDLNVVFGPLDQQSALADYKANSAPTGGYNPALDPNNNQARDKLAARAEMLKDFLNNHQTRATFKLRSMTKSFSTNYVPQLTNLQIPTGYDLETT